MLRSPVIVIGTPRSGTSIVSKWLIENYGVRMTLNGYTDINEVTNDIPDTYEDAHVVGCNSQLNRKKITLKEYKKLMKRFFRKMDKKPGVWGFKDPRLTNGLPWILNYFGNDVTILRTIRAPALVIKSMVEKLGFTEKRAIELINGYHVYFQKTLNGRAVIDVLFDGEMKMPTDFKVSFDKSLSNLERIKL